MNTIQTTFTPNFCHRQLQGLHQIAGQRHAELHRQLPFRRRPVHLLQPGRGGAEALPEVGHRQEVEVQKVVLKATHASWSQLPFWSSNMIYYDIYHINYHFCSISIFNNNLIGSDGARMGAHVGTKRPEKCEERMPKRSIIKWKDFRHNF